MSCRQLRSLRVPAARTQAARQCAPVWNVAFDFLQALASGRKVKPDFEDGVRNQLVLEAIERAARTRRWVTVPGL